MKKELIYEIVMPNFPRVVRLSESRRAKYFKPTDKLAMQYLEKNIYDESTKYEDEQKGHIFYTGISSKNSLHKLAKQYKWVDHKLSTKRIEKRLYNLETKEYVIKNSRVAGTPNDEIINGQSMYNGTYHPHTRDKIMKVLHDYMLPFLEGLAPITSYPLIIDGYMYDRGRTCNISKGKMWDVGNRQFPYNKAFEDVLQHCGVIKQDDFEHIIGPPRLIFRNIDKGVYTGWEHHFPDKTVEFYQRTLVYQIYKVIW